MAISTTIPTNETSVQRNERIKNNELDEQLQLLQLFKISYNANKRINDDGTSNLDLVEIDRHINRRKTLLNNALTNYNQSDLNDYNSMVQSTIITDTKSYNHDRFRPVMVTNANGVTPNQLFERRIIFSNLVSGDVVLASPDKNMGVVVQEVYLDSVQYNMRLKCYIVGVDNYSEMVGLQLSSEILRVPAGSKPEITIPSEQWHDADSNIAPEYIQGTLLNGALNEYIYMVPNHLVYMSTLSRLSFPHGGLGISQLAKTIEKVPGDGYGTSLWNVEYPPLNGIAGVVNTAPTIHFMHDKGLTMYSDNVRIKYWDSLSVPVTQLRQTTYLNMPYTLKYNNNNMVLPTFYGIQHFNPLSSTTGDLTNRTLYGVMTGEPLSQPAGASAYTVNHFRMCDSSNFYELYLVANITVSNGQFVIQVETFFGLLNGNTKVHEVIVQYNSIPVGYTHNKLDTFVFALTLDDVNKTISLSFKYNDFPINTFNKQYANNIRLRTSLGKLGGTVNTGLAFNIPEFAIFDTIQDTRKLVNDSAPNIKSTYRSF